MQSSLEVAQGLILSDGLAVHRVLETFDGGLQVGQPTLEGFYTCLHGRGLICHSRGRGHATAQLNDAPKQVRSASLK